jgi:hypothetical protein
VRPKACALVLSITKGLGKAQPTSAPCISFSFFNLNTVGAILWAVGVIQGLFLFTNHAV